MVFILAQDIMGIQVHLIFQFQKMWNVYLEVVLKYLEKIAIVGNLILRQQHACILVRLLIYHCISFFHIIEESTSSHISPISTTLETFSIDLDISGQQYKKLFLTCFSL